MTRPLIAVIGRRAESVPILRFSATLAAEAMCRLWALPRRGGGPVSSTARAAHGRRGRGRLSAFGGVLLPGGADLSPESHGQERAPETEEPSAFQDAFDLAVAVQAVELGAADVTVCRGCRCSTSLSGVAGLHLSESSSGTQRAPRGRAPSRRGSTRWWARTGSRCPPTTTRPLTGSVRDSSSTAVSDDRCIKALEHHHANVIGRAAASEDLHATSRHDAALFDDLVTWAREREEAAA